MTKTKLTALLTAAVAATLLLAGCTQPAPKPTDTVTPTKTPTSSPTATVAPAQKPVAPPSSSDAALQAANTTVQSFVVRQFELQANPTLGVHYLDPYVTGTASNAASAAVDELTKDQIRLVGKPSTFEADMGSSYASELTVTDGGSSKSVPNGNVHLVGCLSNLGTDQHFVSTGAGGGAVPTPKLQSVAFQYTVVYAPSQKVWLVSAFQNADPSAGRVPTC